jgi:hypothetical protein
MLLFKLKIFCQLDAHSNASREFTLIGKQQIHRKGPYKLKKVREQAENMQQS